MTVVDLLSIGWINPILAFAMSTLGTLLAVLLAIKARARAGRGRGRLLVYASVALGGIGIFQAHLLALLGLGVDGTTLYYHPLTLWVSLGGAIVAVGAGVVLVTFGRPGTVRLIAASIAIGAGIAGSDYAAINAIRGSGDLYYDPMRLAGSAAISVLAGGGVVWFIGSVRGLRSAALAASMTGAAICGMHYTAAPAVGAAPNLLRAVDGSQPVSGVAPMLLLGPLILGGVVLTAMLWFFTLGSSTVYDLRAIFEDPEHSVEIEPWMIAEVTSRIASGPRRSVAVLASRPAASLAAPARRPGDDPAPAITSHIPPDRYPPTYRRAQLLAHRQRT